MMSELAHMLIDAGRWIDQQGWCPATGGNFSIRNDEHSALVTASGRHKGALTEQDFLLVDMDGNAIDSSLKPSAETLLHTALYTLDPQIGAVLHTHSVTATVLSRVTSGDAVNLSGFEMQKSLAGNTTHDDLIKIYAFDNTQDMQALAASVNDVWAQNPLQWGLLVKGHGLYAWGKDINEARRHLEGLEFLFACQLELIRLGKIDG
ncbi:methylthioribulose 1-phosphate dehydratase [Neptunomonas phycophila]|uniref:methylthioribulose 1-phosphate dehydratase n=1 Tax=Neptunomonas phycophila TaxID=1572645 RepID=UPI00248411FC|nr:methylthioribulose 1-phosphate dehydratase [Neptunomonas phycophila]